MVTYAVRRLVQAVGVLFAVSIVVFILLHLLPGGPARALLGEHANRLAIRSFDQQYGLLAPLPIQYIDWVGQLLRGNLGYSYDLNESVDTALAQNLPRTLLLVGVSTFLALGLGVAIGTVQGLRRNGVVDHSMTGFVLAAYSAPSFLLGVVLIWLFSDVTPLLPSTGPTSLAPVWAQIPNLVLPIATLTLVNVALFSRYVRSSVIDNLLEPYVEMARAKGLSPARIALAHVLPNSLLPVITIIGLSLPGILGGALVTESLFNYPGMGLLFWHAAQTDDFPVLLGTTMVVGVAVVLGSLIADLMYAVVDPRVRYV